jgi:CRP-like cAMP-binding protein
MFRRSQKMSLLRRLPLFSELSNKELQLIETLVDDVAVRPGVELAAGGQRGMELAVIVEGQARTTKEGTETLLGPGEFFGVITPLDGGGYWATVEATSPMRLLVAGDPAFSRLLDVAPRLTVKIIRALSHVRGQDEPADSSLHNGSKPVLLFSQA